jgi:hypothetical protein
LRHGARRYSTPNPKKSSPAGAIPQAMAKVWGGPLILKKGC